MGPNTTMPVSVCDSTAAVICSAIRDSLAATAAASGQVQLNGHHSHGLNGQVAASVKHSHLTKIDYEEAPVDFKSSVHDDLKTKYSCLNVTAGSGSAMAVSCHNAAGPLIGPVLPIQNTKEVDHIPAPKKILFPRENVQIGWKTGHKWQVGAGMVNVGNTCYLNSTLQALFHVPAFANWLLSDEEHRENCEELCGSQGGCIVCAMSKTLISSQKSQQAMKPWLVYSKLRFVCRHLVPGHQEDAHEFLRYLMEAMEKAFLLRFKNSKDFEQYTKETTPINQILGGYLKSSVRCLACSHISVTFQHFEDLLLDIRKANSIEEALDGHFARERLEDMGYKCEACKKKVSATKQFSLERPPVALCIQLKRFSMMGGKLNKQVTIKQKLDLSPYASKKSTEPWTYRLVSMVTHLGASQHCGHYTAIGLTDTGSYYQFDDSCVRSISLQNVLNTNAYIVFYELEDPSAKQSSAATVTSRTVTSSLSDAKDNRNKSMFGDTLLELGKANSNASNRCFSGTLIPSQVVKQTLNINGTKYSNVSTETSPNGSANRAGADSNGYTNGGSKLVNSPNKVINGYASANKVHSPPHSIVKPNQNADSKNLIRLKINPKKEQESATKLTDASVKKSTPSVVMNGSNTMETKSDSLSLPSSLPSMPKLDSSPTTPPTTPSTALSKLSFGTAVSDDKTNRKSSNFIKINNGPAISSMAMDKPKSLVPYTTDDDSDSNQTNSSLNSNKNHRNGTTAIYRAPVEVKKRESPPIVRTNSAGDWHVSPCDTNKITNTTNPFAKVRPTSAVSPNNLANKHNPSQSNKFQVGNLGRSSSDPTVNKMQKLSQIGYGAPVKSWNGQQSNMDREVAFERLEDRKRSYTSADDDLDRGRQKKIKTHSNGITGRDNTSSNNPFQEHQNHQSINQRQWHLGPQHYSRQNLYKHNFRRNHYRTSRYSHHHRNNGFHRRTA